MFAITLNLSTPKPKSCLRPCVSLINSQKTENVLNICLFEILSEIFLCENFTNYGTLSRAAIWFCDTHTSSHHVVNVFFFPLACTHVHLKQPNKNFVAMIMKGLASTNKSLCESAVVCGADLFTACTYVGDRSSQIFRYFITQMQGQLQVSVPYMHIHVHCVHDSLVWSFCYMNFSQKYRLSSEVEISTAFVVQYTVPDKAVGTTPNCMTYF